MANLTPSVLSEMVFQVHARPFVAKISESLNVQQLSLRLKDELKQSFDIANSYETQSLTRAAVAIGVLSIINIGVALFTGLMSIDSNKVESNLRKLAETTGQGVPFSLALLSSGALMVLLVSVSRKSPFVSRLLINLRIYFLTSLSIGLTFWALLPLWERLLK
jgi:hypothetical protein